MVRGRDDHSEGVVNQNEMRVQYCEIDILKRTSTLLRVGWWGSWGPGRYSTARGCIPSWSRLLHSTTPMNFRGELRRYLTKGLTQPRRATPPPLPPISPSPLSHGEQGGRTNAHGPPPPFAQTRKGMCPLSPLCPSFGLTHVRIRHLNGSRRDSTPHSHRGLRMGKSPLPSPSPTPQHPHEDRTRERNALSPPCLPATQAHKGSLLRPLSPRLPLT